RLDEALAVCKRLWSEPVVEHRGEFFAFPPVAFEPKPVQRPWPPIHVGGESDAALRRAAFAADGWVGLVHDVASAGARVRTLRALRREAGREGERFEVTLGAERLGPDDLRRWEDAGVDRLILSPWRRSSEAIGALRRIAELALR
ncbi:MAG: LLM class flavin-dependent oxidoreductase, partial [Myxococcales bacterium]